MSFFCFSIPLNPQHCANPPDRNSCHLDMKEELYPERYTVSAESTSDWWIQTFSFETKTSSLTSLVVFGRKRYRHCFISFDSGRERDLLRFSPPLNRHCCILQILAAWWFGHVSFPFWQFPPSERSVEILSSFCLPLFLRSFYSSTEVVVSDAAVYGGRGV